MLAQSAVKIRGKNVVYQNMRVREHMDRRVRDPVKQLRFSA